MGGRLAWLVVLVLLPTVSQGQEQDGNEDRVPLSRVPPLLTDANAAVVWDPKVNRPALRLDRLARPVVENLEFALIPGDSIDSRHNRSVRPAPVALVPNSGA